MSFTDQKQRVVTKEDLTAPWSGYKDGSHFFCRLCGHLFEEGDKWRWVCAGEVHLINLQVCSNCDGTNEKVLAKWVKLWQEWEELAKGKFRFIAIQFKEFENELRHFE